MSSTFYGLEIAKSGLYATQKAMEVIGNNIANADTDGYSRQRLGLSSVSNNPSASTWVSTEVHAGSGVSIDGVQQIRSEYYDKQYRTQKSTLSDLSTRSSLASSVETILKATSSSGAQTVLQKFYNDIQTLSGSADSFSIRTLVRSDAESVCTTMKYYSDQLVALQDSQDDSINITVSQINDLVDQVSSLNDQIATCNRTNANPNDLLDKRNLALDNLSSLVDISYSEGENGAVSIYMGANKTDATLKDNYCLLDGDTGTAYKLVSTQDKSNYYGTNTTAYHNVALTSKTGTKISVNGDSLAGGNLKGYFDNRDGDSEDNTGIAYTLSQLDTLVRGVVSAYNKVNSTGYGIPNDENGNVSTTGINFFDDQAGDLTKVNASNMAVSDAIKQSVYNIAASSKKVDLTATNTQQSNNENAMLLVGVATATDLDTIGSIDKYLQSVISNIAVASNHYSNLLDNQQTIVNSITTNRKSVSGVSTDEETTNILATQKSYAAVCHVISVLNDMFDTLLSMVNN